MKKFVLATMVVALIACSDKENSTVVPGDSGAGEDTAFTQCYLKHPNDSTRKADSICKKVHKK